MTRDHAIKLEEMLHDEQACKDIQVVQATDEEVEQALDLIFAKYDLEHKLLK